jgi:hypothetical protein
MFTQVAKLPPGDAGMRWLAETVLLAGQFMSRENALDLASQSGDWFDLREVMELPAWEKERSRALPTIYVPRDTRTATGSSMLDDAPSAGRLLDLVR